MPQQEITESGPLLDAQGRPRVCGWSRTPLLQYDRGLIRSAQRRIMETDRYVLITDRHVALFEVLDGGYLGGIGVCVADLAGKVFWAEQYGVPFPLGAFGLSGNSETGSFKVRQKKLALDFAVLDGASRIVKIDAPGFGRGLGLRGAVVLTVPPHAESLVNVTSWRKERAAFRYSRRSPWYTAEGMLQLGNEELAFSKDGSWGVLDWSRGVRPRRDFKYWASASGLVAGRQFSFSLAYGAADSSLGTENALFRDGVLHKLNQVTVHISPRDWLKPWRFAADDKRLEMTFEPALERSDRQSILFNTMKRRQVFGRFYGQAVLDDGEMIEFGGLPGFAERCKTYL